MGKKKKSTSPLSKTITLSESSQLNQKIIDELDELFKLASPATLQKSVMHIYFQYLYYTTDVCCDSQFRHISEDFYLLQRFLGECREGFEEHLNEKL